MKRDEVEVNFFKNFEEQSGEPQTRVSHSIRGNSCLNTSIQRNEESDRYKEGFEECKNSFLSEDGMYIYHLGIIDYLQDYNLQKKLETKLKSIYHDDKLISCVPPKFYSQRFNNFMKEHVIINQI